MRRSDKGYYKIFGLPNLPKLNKFLILRFFRRERTGEETMRTKGMEDGRFLIENKLKK